MMKNLKTFLIAICLFAGFNSFSQEVSNVTTDIIYEGSVWYLDKSQTHVTDWIEESNMLELLALQTIIHTPENTELWGVQKDLVQDGDLLLGIPFMSCGIGYDYYKLIQSGDNYLLFESLDNYNQTGKKVIVLNKRM